METRKIIIVDSSANQKVVVNTDAVTFGDLKRAARAAGINYEDKDWLEGLTKTSPIGDDSLLPTNIPYKGTTTNNLVYMLTNTNKKIRSGATRKELYAEVKALALADDIKAKFGKNFTQVSNDSLIEFIEKAKQANKASSDVFEKKYRDLIDVLAKCATIIPANILDEIAVSAANITPVSIIEDVEFSDDELNALFEE